MKWIGIIVSVFIFSSLQAQEYFFRQMPSDYGRDIQHIKIIFQAPDHMIWLGTDKGLYSFDGRTYRLFPRPDNAIQTVSTISSGLHGEVWAGYNDGYLQVISNEGTVRAVDSEAVQGIPVTKILFDRTGEAYFTTYGRGLWSIEGNSIVRVPHAPADQMNDIYDAWIDAKGRLWMGTDHGIWIFDKMANELRNINHENGLPDDIVIKLRQDDNGDIWVGYYEGGFGKYIASKDTIIEVLNIDGQNENIAGMSTGYEHDMWFALEKSVIRYTKGEARHIKLPLTLTGRIEDIHCDRTGNLWISSGSKLFMTNTQLEFRYPSVKGIQSIGIDDDLIWLGCESGLFSMQVHSGEIQAHLADQDLNVLSLYRDDAGLIWIGTFGQGLWIYNPSDKKARHMDEDDGISNNSILNIDGTEGSVWLATLGGITQVDWKENAIITKPTITRFHEKFNFPAGYVYDVNVDAKGKAWFGTDGKGLYYLHDNKLKPFTLPFQIFRTDSFDLRTIYSVTSDRSDHIWVSATKGNILKLDSNGVIIDHIPSPYGSLNSLNTSGHDEIVIVRENLIQLKDPLSGISVFGPNAGLVSFSPHINSTAQDQDGSIWIGDTDKVLHYKPIPSDTVQYVHLELVSVKPGSLFGSDPIRIHHDSNFIDFRFTGLWYSDPQAVKYRYMLQGHDKDWIYTQEGRAVYSKLSAGSYTFIVEGSHHDDFSQSIPIKKQITVLPPFYFTWWFIAGVIAVISGLAYKYARERIRRINRFHQLEKEKTTLQLHAIQAQVNPHFLFNSFNTLSGIIEQDQEAAVDYVDQLSSFFRGVLMHRNEELISLAEEIEIMRNYSYILKRRYGEGILILENIQTTEGFIAPLTLQLLIENAIKHNTVSDEKPLKILITADDRWLTVSNPIQPKFHSVTESTGFGLSSLLTRYQYLARTKIEITNDGIQFTVRIPILQVNVTL